MRKPFYFYFFLMFLVLHLGACKIPLSPEIKGVSEFKLNGKNNGKPTGFGIGLDVYNPNNHRIKILAYDLDVFVNGKKLGNANRRGKQVMLKYSNSTLHFDIETDIKQIFTSIFSALGGLIGKDKNVEVNLKGVIVGKAHGIRKKIPIDYTKSVGFSD